MATRRWRAGYAIILTLCITLVLSCGLVGAGARRGLIVPPDVDLDLGAIRLIGDVTIMPICPQFTACLMGEPARVNRVYTVWAFIRVSRQPGDPPRIIRLLAVMIGETFGPPFADLLDKRI